ncbi:uncharacterized protein LAESUDRAFT_719662 [Laetiporus sulphureus 93-53]|uniref:F-box domain-containing protein n=1 Tax=Laetiporus sulphureus 93-53 TaxID=1314785 RepID=A0A165IMV6_9APHY|nr:uncharacterized protein LAESUDRAFT_719662 [Laetiporus sulphureus 93-53]KZT13300.1 hypothetical protein LAESUDRAFT_719662 [Laetiporus sulphureus 93-53]
MLNNDDFLKQLGSLCGDIEELYIEPKYSYGHGLLTTFDRPAPLLRSLTIGRVSMYPDERLPQMFAGSTPKLERLTLRGYVRWPDNAFSDLTHLCLHDQFQHARPSLAEFLDFLDASPRLEQLVLVDAGPTVWNAQDAEIVGGRVVSLPRLKCLDIGYWDSVRSVMEFLSHMDISDSAALNVWSRSCTVGSSGNFLKSILPPDLRRLGPLRSLTTIRVTSRTHMQGLPGTRGMGNGDENIHVLSAHNGTLQLLGDFNVPEAFPTILDRFDLTHMQTLTLSSGEALRLSESQWKRVLSSVPRLRTLTVLPATSSLLLPLLDHSEQASPAAHLLCPELGSITVMDGRESTIPLLVRLAAQRLRQGRPLQKLCVVGDARSEIAALDGDAQMQLLGCVTEVEYKERVADAVRAESPQWPSAAYIWARGASQVSV